jgi:hypothetical protein
MWSKADSELLSFAAYMKQPSRVQKHTTTTIKIHNTLASPTLLYGSENWTMKAKDKTRIIAANKKFMRTLKYTWMD